MLSGGSEGGSHRCAWLGARYLLMISRIRGIMASRPTLYSMPISHWCISADRMLAFKGVPFDTTYVPYHDKTELIAARGQDYVPTLVWDGKPVMWYDIPDFLERERPGATLDPWGQG